MSAEDQMVGSARSIRLIDYAGHPFTTDLATALADRGHAVSYAYLASNKTSPHGADEWLESSGVKFNAVDIGHEFEKFKPVRRALDEIHFGLRLVRRADAERVVVACQLPVLTAWLVLLAARLRRQHFVLWVQDLQADLAKIRAAGFAAKFLGVLERSLLRRASGVICISDQMAKRAAAYGRTRPVSVLPNWAPLARLPATERDNGWADAASLAPTRFRLLYAGTLGAKHRAGDIAALSTALADDQVEIVVVAAGVGAKELRSIQQDCGCLRLLPLQPVEELPQVLGAADALLVTLDSRVDEAAVPSKVLAYLCAERPIIALMPESNPAAKTVVNADAGVVVGDVAGAAEAVRSLMGSPEERLRFGKNGRTYAENHFGHDIVCDQFLAAIREQTAD